MKRLALRAGIVAVIATSFGSQGCLVTWRKHVQVKKRLEALELELQQKESQLAADTSTIQSLREDVKARDHLIKLYNDKSIEAQELARATREELERMQGQLDKRLQDIATKHPGVEVGPGHIRIKDTLLFALGSAEISEQGKTLINDIAAKFKGTGEIIRIDGHTDDIPVKKPETVRRFTDNWGLSSARAAAVLRLLEKGGIRPDRMYLSAYSMYRPHVEDAKDEASRSKNRRVEVVFIPRRLPAAAEPEEEPKQE